MKVSSEANKYIKKYKKNKMLILFTQIFISILFLIIWQLLSNYKIINSFIFSSPLNIIKTIKNLFINNNLLSHIFVTLNDVIISFLLVTIISFVVSIILYKSEFLYKVFDPYLTMLNALPKVALGPIIIIWMGANEKSIILMSILISIIVSIQNIYYGFINTDELKIRLLRSFNASKINIFFKVVLPYNLKNIINTLKINISMCLIGTVMGEFLTSKEGIGYLILYGSQIFDLNLVMSGVVILIILSVLLYLLITLLEKHLIKY